MSFQIQAKEKSHPFIGIYDFSYAPYALGDAFTWQVNVAIGALDKGIDTVIHSLVVDPRRPSGRLQPHINRENYRDYLSNLFPAFLCNPLEMSLKLFTNRHAFDYYLLKKVLSGFHTWPNLLIHTMEQMDYYSHKKIDKFFQKNHYIPRLKTPRGYENSMDDFLKEHCSGRFLVSVNIRQRANYADLGFAGQASGVIRRDSPLQEWYRFFKVVRKKYPDVLFLAFGGYAEWEKELYTFENVLIPRAMGYNLAHEITLFHQTDLFMGTSSGFSALATFSEIPYIITNFDHAAAKYVDLPIGAPSYRFALDNQIIVWEKETVELLMSLFEPVYQMLKTQ
jgi:hypothetical protein